MNKVYKEAVRQSLIYQWWRDHENLISAFLGAAFIVFFLTLVVIALR